MRLLYSPLFNRLVRTALRPLRLPERFQFPVTGPIRVRPPGGEPFALHCNPTSYLAKALFWGGVSAFEPEVVPVFRSLARASSVLVDVGANIGYYSLLAKSYNPAIEVAAFEPSPDPFHVLVANTHEAGVVAEQKALGAAPGRLAFYPARNPKYPDMAQLGGTGSVHVGHVAVHGKETHVVVDTLDGIAERRPTGAPPIDLVKIDVEGAELSVLQGAVRTLATDKPVVLFESLARTGTRAEVLRMFGEHDYTVRLVTDRGLVPVADDAGPWTNYVAVPTGSDRLGPFETRR